jgi:hypothetical protein
MVMRYTHDVYCDVLLTLGVGNSWADTAAQEYEVHYLGHSHPDANVFSDWSSVSMRQEEV